MTERLPLNKQIIKRTHELFKYETDTDNYQKGIKLVSQGKIPIKVSNHTTLGDGVVDIFFSENLMKIPGNKINGVYIIIADSLSEERQGEGSAKAFKIFSDYIAEKEWLELVKVPYVLDRKKIFNQEESGKIKSAISENKMVIIYPEGRTLGGRPKEGSHDPDDVNGMIKAKKIDRMLIRYLEKNNNFFIWPIAIINGHKVFSPVDYDNHLPGFYENLNSNQSYEPIAEVRFGEPILPEILSAIKNKTTYTMIKIAEMCPKKQWGFYNPENFRTNLENL